MDLKALVDAINLAEDNFERAMLAEGRMRHKPASHKPPMGVSTHDLTTLVESAIRQMLFTQGRRISHMATTSSAGEQRISLLVTVEWNEEDSRPRAGPCVST
jgi:hypothetical protein